MENANKIGNTQLATVVVSTIAAKCKDGNVIQRLRELMVKLVLKKRYVYNDCGISIIFNGEDLSVVIRTNIANIYIKGTTMECDMYLSPKLGEAV